MALAPGQILDAKYRVGRLIGEGGMGTVYEGENTRIGRRVAIKVLHAQVASMPEFVERFEREARAAARIGSPHVCDVIDLGDLPSGDRYIVMEYLDGVSFEDRLEECVRMTPAQLAPIAFELLDGLATMHAARVIHRDLKPANVFLARTTAGRGEIVKILDFGVAKLLPTVGEAGSMTQTGMMMGTPLYMSPEQARGAKDIDGRTDVYAASVMFYRALTGVLPHAAESLNELLFKIVLEDPKPIRQLVPEVDDTFAALVHKGLARDVEERFLTARDYQAALAAWGKTQGRTSLSFAITIPSEPPPAPTKALPGGESALGVLGAKGSLPRGASTPAGAERPTTAPASASASVSVNSGTPTAWSDDGPEVALALAGAAEPSGGGLRPAAGAQAQPTTGANKLTGPLTAMEAAEAAELAMARTSAIPSEPPPRAPSSEASGASTPASQATTDPSRVAPSFVNAKASATSGSAGTSRLVLGALGAVALVAVAVVALGRGGPSGAAASTSTSPGDPSSSAGPSSVATSPAGTPVDKRDDPKNVGSATAALGSAASSSTAAPLSPGGNGEPMQDGGGVSAAGAQSPNGASASGGATPPSRHDLTPGVAAVAGRKQQPLTTASASAAVVALPGGTSAPDPAPSTAPAKPAASGRKYRTNID
jgi:serine/threonine-protein kinase